MGGTATEQDGTFGTELVCEVPMQLPDGQPGHAGQPDQRPRGPQLAAARDADGPARRRARVRRALGGDDPLGRRTTGARSDGPGCAAAAHAAARRASGRLNAVTRGSPPSDYARRMAEHKDGLRATISRWASQDRDEARELRKDTRKAGLVAISDAPDRQRVIVQGTLQDGHAASARRRAGSRGGAVRRVRVDQRGLARTPAHRRHHARSRHPGRGTHRRPGPPAGHVQPALRAEVPVIRPMIRPVICR